MSSRWKVWWRTAVVVMLAGSLAAAVLAWAELRKQAADLATGVELDELSLAVDRMSRNLYGEPAGLTTEPGALRQRLAGLISNQAVDAKAREALIRADALLTTAGRGSADPDGALHEILGDAVTRICEAASATRVRAGEAGASAGNLLAVSAALLGLALGMVLLDLGLSLRRRQQSPVILEQPHTPLNSLLSAAVRSTEEGILISSTGQRGSEPMIVYANPALCRMVGHELDDLVGQPLAMLRRSYLREKEFSLLEHSFSNSKSATTETVRWQEDGSKVHCEWHISPVRESSSRVTHYVSILRDITRLREQEAAQRRSHDELIGAHHQLKENQKQLIHSEKMAFLGQLAAGVAHEINNPVAYVMSNLETLAEDLDEIDKEASEKGLDGLPEDAATALLESISGLDRVKDIVQGLKDFARPDEGTIEPADLNEEIEKALRIVANEIKHRCTVEKRLTPLPPLACHPGQLNQVLTNLLANAAHAIPQHGTITINSECIDSEIVIRIADDGEGIAEENLPNLFTPFFTTKPAGQGTGLGLSVSYGIVEKHNGSIEVASKVGEGTTFTIRLPVA